MYWTVIETPKPCPCGHIHNRDGCDLAADMDRAVSRQRQDSREAAQGFRWANEFTPDYLRKRPKREHERSCTISGTVGDFWENFR